MVDGRTPWLCGLLVASACFPTPEAALPNSVAATATSASVDAHKSAPSPFLKGQLHLHSNNSGDSDTPPADVIRWYAEKNYDFIVFTDHNRITEVQGSGKMLVLPGIELTNNPQTCAPAPEANMQCLLHVNALLIEPAKADAAAARAQTRSVDRMEIYGQSVELTEQLGGISMLNHPNFHYAADAQIISELGRQGLSLLEVANEALDSNNQGDARHPSTETLWDKVLTAGARVYATATDDAHHYYDADDARARGELAFEGDRGWVMVRAERSASSIREALRRGDFYASTGVVLADVRTSGTVLEVDLGLDSPGEHEIRFVGDGGRVLHRTQGRSATYDLATGKRSAYVRAVVEDDDGRKAWTQPLFKSER